MPIENWVAYYLAYEMVGNRQMMDFCLTFMEIRLRKDQPVRFSLKTGKYRDAGEEGYVKRSDQGIEYGRSI